MATTIAELFETDLAEEISGGRVIKLVYSESKNMLSVVAEFDKTVSAKALSDASETVAKGLGGVSVSIFAKYYPARFKKKKKK